MAELKKRIADIKVIAPGSNPDVDSDFHTEVREVIRNYVSDLYGHDNVADIVTFNSSAAKKAFKSMCTIYEIPFAAANKVSALVPPSIEGVDCTINDIFDPESERYPEGAEFRSATAGKEWETVIKGALAIEGRYNSLGMHPCGVIISSKPLYETIPLMVRQKDGRVLTQWSYPECEDMGLIKFDFLGLKTVDIIMRSVEYIKDSGQTPPNMIDLIHGPMNDKKTYDVFSSGHTLGVFQFGSAMVQDFCKLMKPEEFNDIAATTAMLRPGPMGMQSHVRYAFRKNGREEYSSLHPEFVGSPLDKILEPTYGLIIYQEQIQQIANQICGMTLQEGDQIRKAMGKKKKEVMDAMGETFIQGGVRNGYSLKAMEDLWTIVAEFARYGFNKAHSIAYAMNAYQTAYLKANYPAYFMAALISQSVINSSKDEILEYLKEAKRMNLKVGGVDVNSSDVLLVPDYKNLTDFDIVYGFSGVSNLSRDVAKTIIKERSANGSYSSVQDFINRCVPLGITNRKIYENLTLAGAFDRFGIKRKAVVENLNHMIEAAKTKNTKGASLFDMMAGTSDAITEEMDLTAYDDYSHVERLQNEASVIGFYLTGHPLENLGSGLSNGGVTSIAKIMAGGAKTTQYVVGSLTDVTVKKMKNGGKNLRLTIDDGSGYIEANLSKDFVKGIDKRNAQLKMEELYQKGETSISSEIVEVATNQDYLSMDNIEKNNVYLINLSYQPPYGDSPYGARINFITPLSLGHDGELPIRIRVKSKSSNPEVTQRMMDKMKQFAEQVSKNFPGPYPIQVAIFTPESLQKFPSDEYYSDLADLAETEVVEASIAASSTFKNTALFGGDKEKKAGRSTGKNDIVRELPQWRPTPQHMTEQEISYTVTYIDTGFTADKNSKVEELLSNKFGGERVDYGVFNATMLDDE